jgi:hypothetical protein
MAYQISVFLENKPAHLEKLTAALEKANVNIRAVTISTGSTGWGIVNMLVDRPEEGCDTLKASHHAAVLRPIVVVELEDRPGGLRRILSLLKEAGLNVENAYGSVLGKEKRAVLVIDVQNVKQAEEVLANAGIKVLKENEIYSL